MIFRRILIIKNKFLTTLLLATAFSSVTAFASSTVDLDKEFNVTNFGSHQEALDAAEQLRTEAKAIAAALEEKQVTITDAEAAARLAINYVNGKFEITDYKSITVAGDFIEASEVDLTVTPDTEDHSAKDLSACIKELRILGTDKYVGTLVNFHFAKELAAELEATKKVLTTAQSDLANAESGLSTAESKLIATESDLAAVRIELNNEKSKTPISSNPISEALIAKYPSADDADFIAQYLEEAASEERINTERANYLERKKAAAEELSRKAAQQVEIERQKLAAEKQALISANSSTLAAVKSQLASLGTGAAKKLLKLSDEDLYTATKDDARFSSIYTSAAGMPNLTGNA